MIAMAGIAFISMIGYCAWCMMRIAGNAARREELMQACPTNEIDWLEMLYSLPDERTVAR